MNYLAYGVAINSALHRPRSPVPSPKVKSSPAAGVGGGGSRGEVGRAGRRRETVRS